MRRAGWRNERGVRPSRLRPWLVRTVAFPLALALGAATGALHGEELLAKAFPARAAQVRLALLGNEQAPARELAAAAGVGPGVRLASLDLARVRAGVLAHPWVREARVAALPPDLLIVAVSEREPVAVARIGERAWLVDRTGRAFAPAPADSALPRLGGATAPDDPRLADGVAWLEALAAHGIAAPAELRVADADPARAPALLLGPGAPAPGARVLLGEGERDAKLARLARLFAAGLPDLASTGEIDLRFGADVILRPPPGGEVADVSNGG